jgi:hypothetical protein
MPPYYHKVAQFSDRADHVYHKVGSSELPSAELVKYALSVQGISTIIVGIGHIDDDTEKCQLSRNLADAQLAEPLDEVAMAAIEARLTAAWKHRANDYFQRRAIGLTPPRNVGGEPDSSSQLFGRLAVRVTWDTSYAGAVSIERYDVLRDGEVVGSVLHAPQFTTRRFCYDDVFPEGQPSGATATACGRSISRAQWQRAYLLRSIPGRSHESSSPFASGKMTQAETLPL